MIQNLMFDLGGVIMNIDRHNCIAAFRRLGMEHPEDFLGEYVQKGVFMEVEQGLIDAATFRQEIRRMMPADGAGISDDDIDHAFSDFLLGIPPYRLRWLRSLRGRYKIYLLSNTNPIMWNGRIRQEFEQEGYSIDDYFDGIVTSFEAKSLKPSAEIFEYALRRFGIRADETLFLDDSTANLEASAALGFRTAHVEAPRQEFMTVLESLGLA